MTIKINGNAPELAEFVPTYSQHKQWRHFWNTPESFAAHVASINPNDCWDDQAWNDNQRQRGTADMPEALELCRSGWKEGAERAAALRDRINAANPIGPRMIKWDVAGAYPSVSRALSGNPLNMRRIDSARLRHRPIITLLSDASVHFGIRADAMSCRAAVVAAVVDAVEGAGFACQIITVCAAGESNVLWSIATQIKESSQPADIGRVAFALGHPAYFRRLSFAIATENEITEPLGSGLGMPHEVEISDAMRDRQVFNLPSCNNETERLFRSDDIAATEGLRFIIDSLKAQGCPAFPNEERDAA